MYENQTLKLVESSNKIFLFYINITMIPIGLILNLASLLVFTRLKFMNLRLGIFYQVITISDIGSIIFCFAIFFGKSIDKNVLLYSNFNCKIINYTFRVCLQMSSCTNVLLTLDRFLIIKYPYERFEIIYNKKKLRFVVFILFCFICFINAPNLWMYLIDMPGVNTKDKICYASPILISIRDMIGIIFRNILPLVAILILNSILIRALFQLKQKVCNRRSMKKEASFTFSIIIMNLFYYLNLIPIAVVLIYFNLMQKNSSKFSMLKLIGPLCAYISMINQCFPFVINFIFNKVFRKEFLCLFKRNK